ncbi:Acetyltransferase YpeA [Methanimicrococcus stummii]|uniref:Acetyltransferase YpeA n=1 Tax=Methanimicrococcus stummii TaxID=3028294 RepID=A0AA96ZZ76_9EURY|nr:GNAT family N-acetyltransferase [Methanimicrococcus sp. Es2]WNY28972.1 Acetyltransferase YpeA [Methanimicrococcus sp. Es2]
MKFSEFKPEHIPEVSDLFIKAFNAPPWNDTWTSETAAKRLAQQTSSPYTYGLICEIDGQIAGMIVGNEEQYCDELCFEIREFCTSVDYRDRGVGKSLIRELEARLKERGITKVTLATIHGENTVGVYQKMNYEISNDIVMMEKKI